MFGLEILDVVIGLTFVYLLLSLLATALNEYIAAVLNLRGKELAKGLGQLLDDLDEGDALQRAWDGVGPKLTARTDLLTERLYNHRLIRPMATRQGWMTRMWRWMRGRRGNPRLPSYIPARTFALALLDVLGVDEKDASLKRLIPVPEGKTPAQAAADAVEAATEDVNAAEYAARGARASGGREVMRRAAAELAEARTALSRARLAQVLAILTHESSVDLVEHLKTLRELPNAEKLPAELQAHVAGLLAGGQTQLQKLHDGVEVWFNNSMDRVSGAYKRTVQGSLFFLGLVIASCSNADTIDMWRRLSENDELRSAMAKRAGETVASLEPYVRPDTTRTDTTTTATAGQQGGTPVTAGVQGGPTLPIRVAGAAPTTTRQTRDTISADSAAKLARANYQTARARLDSMELKLGWTRHEAMRIGVLRADTSYKATPPRRAPFNLPFWLKLIGLLMTATAISLGAPFWFDLLNKVISIRAAGRAPNERPKSPEGGPKRAAETTPK